MFEWLVRKNEAARVYMCIKEVKWELETAEPVKRATILAMAQMHHETMSEGGVDYGLDNPLNHGREMLIELYRLLEDVRNSSRVQLDTAKADMRRLGRELPQFAVDHAKINTRGVEVWMCTVGAGISPHLHDDVRQIWTYLEGSRAHVEAAIRNLRDVEKRMCEVTGAVGGFLPIPDQEWKSLCDYVPAAFRGRFG